MWRKIGPECVSKVITIALIWAYVCWEGYYE